MEIETTSPLINGTLSGICLSSIGEVTRSTAASATAFRLPVTWQMLWEAER